MDHNLDTSDIQFLEEGKFCLFPQLKDSGLKQVKILKQNLCCISDLISYICITFTLEELSKGDCFADWTEVILTSFKNKQNIFKMLKCISLQFWARVDLISVASIQEFGLEAKAKSSKAKQKQTNPPTTRPCFFLFF